MTGSRYFQTDHTVRFHKGEQKEACQTWEGRKMRDKVLVVDDVNYSQVSGHVFSRNLSERVA